MPTNFKFATPQEGQREGEARFPLLGKVISVGSGTFQVDSVREEELLKDILTQLKLSNLYNSLAQDEELDESEITEGEEDA